MDTIGLVVEPTPLKNDGVRQLGWWHSQYNIWKIKNVPNHQPAIDTLQKYASPAPRSKKKRTSRRSPLKPSETIWHHEPLLNSARALTHQLTAGRKVEKPEGITLQSHIVNYPSTLVVDHTSSIQKTIGHICPWNIKILWVVRFETEKAPGWHLFCHLQTHTKTSNHPGSKSRSWAKPKKKGNVKPGMRLTPGWFLGGLRTAPKIVISSATKMAPSQWSTARGLVNQWLALHWQILLVVTYQHCLIRAPKCSVTNSHHIMFG